MSREKINDRVSFVACDDPARRGEPHLTQVTGRRMDCRMC